MSCRAALALGLGCLAAYAQAVPEVGKLSATSNGLAVYAATNLTLRDEPANAGRKLVKWDAGQWATAIRSWGDGREYRRLQEDASGRVQIYTATFPCGVPTPICISSEAGVVHWRNRDTGVTWPIGYGAGGVSDNGEWAVAATDVPTPESLGPEIRRVRLADGRTETAVTYSRLAGHPVRRIVADNGLIALARGGIFLLWRPGSQVEQSRTEPSFESYAIDPAGGFLLGTGGTFHWEGTEALFHTLYRMDLDTRTLTPVAQTPLGILQPDLASDGHKVVFLSAADWEGRNPHAARQVWLADLYSDAKQQLTSETSGVREVALAANGSAVFALTQNLRLLRIDLLTGRTEAIAPEYPRILAQDPVTAKWAHGGRYWLWGRGFGDAEILAGNVPAQVTAQSPDDVEFLVPGGEGAARVGAKASPFQPLEVGVPIVPAAPAFLGSAGREITWLHEDGATPVTPETPARLGETITARMTGMGPVDADGNTTLDVQWSLVESYLSPRGTRIPVRTAVPVLRSRATGEPGVYLATIRLPETLRGGSYTYDGIEAALAGFANLSRPPLHVP